jgi:C-methyltransferase C-terminal domain
VPEAELRAARPDYVIVFPWHFREAIIDRESDYLRAGGKLIFPLPEIEIVGS